MARILPATDPEALQEAAELLREGEVVGMPTETVYGLAANAFQAGAILRVFEVKERPRFDPLILHIGIKTGMDPWEALLSMRLVDEKKLSPLACERAGLLSREFWPGPLTLILPKTDRVSDLATSGLSHFAVRAPRHPAAQALLSLLPFPLVAPSANRFGRVSPVKAADVEMELGDRIPLILDGGTCEIGVESTVLAVQENGDLELLRPGGVSIEEITSLVGIPPSSPATGSAKGTLGLASPGRLPSHYAPAKPLYLLPKSIREFTPEEFLDWLKKRGLHRLKLGVLFCDESAELELLRLPILFELMEKERVLSETGDPREAARNLFAFLRELDASDAGALLAEPWPDSAGLGAAIQDRLARASTRPARTLPSTAGA